MIGVIKILQLEDVFFYHDLVIASTGGDSGVRDRSLVESAYYAAFQSFDGRDLFETLEEKASRIGFGLAKNHGFVDGNKRVGCLVLTSFLEINGIILQCPSEELADMFYSIASGESSYEDLLSFVKRYATHTSLEHRRWFMKEKRNINVREACKRYSKRIEAKRRKMESEADIDQMMLQIMQDAMPDSDVEIRPDGSMEITQE